MFYHLKKSEIRDGCLFQFESIKISLYFLRLILSQVKPFLKNLNILLQLNTEWSQVEVIDLVNDGSGLGFGIIGGRSTGVVVKTILPGGVADRVSI